jgi:hypothetical protein
LLLCPLLLLLLFLAWLAASSGVATVRPRGGKGGGGGKLKLGSTSQAPRASEWLDLICASDPVTAWPP